MFESKHFPLLLSLILLISILPVLGLPQVGGSSEAREAHVAQIIRDTGEWILPERNGFVPSKPLLYHWISVSVSYFTGVANEFSARMPSALLGIFLVAALYSFSRKIFSLFPSNQFPPATLAFLSCFALLTNYGFFHMLFIAMVDMTFAVFVVLALLQILLPVYSQISIGQSELRISTKIWIQFFVLCGFATLAKGPLGLVLPSIMLFSALVVLVGWGSALRLCLRPNRGWLCYSLIALPWYILANTKSQSELVQRQLIFENLKRFAGGENINSEPFWFYLPSFLSKAAPWSFVFVALLIWFIFNKQNNLQRRIIKSLLFSLLAAFLLFSAASGKRHSYLLPLFPLASFVGVWIFQQWSARVCEQTLEKMKRFSLRLLNGVVIFAFGLCLLGIFLAAAESILTKPEYSLAAQWLRANLILLFLAPAIATFVLLKFRSEKLLAKFFVVVAVFASVLSSYYGIKAAFRDYSGMAKTILASASERKLVAVRDRFDELLDPIFLYLGRPVPVVAPKDMPSNCDSKTLFFTRRSNLDGFPKNIILKEEGNLREKVGKPSSLDQREISLFTCSYHS